MAGMDWGMLLLVVYPLAQVPLVLYLARWFDLEGETPAATPGRACWTGGSREDGPSLPATPQPGQCGRCGTANDPGYTFCRSCLARL